MWERIWRKLLQKLDEQKQIDFRQVYLDGSFVSSKRGGTGIGKTKVGKGSKVMIIADGNGLPIGFTVHSAQPHEIQLAEKTLHSVRIPQKRGRPKSRLKERVADRAYSSEAFRRFLRKRQIKPIIPYKKNLRRKHRPLNLDDAYKQRWKIERCFAWLDNYHRLVVRYDYYIQHYKAFCLIALILLCINQLLK